MHDIIISDLRFSYKPNQPVLNIDDLKLKGGSITSILGSSGCGKTTLLNLISGLVTPQRGEIILFGRKPQEIRNEGELSFVFQDPTLIPWLTVFDNVKFPFTMMDKTIASVEIEHIINLVGMKEHSEKYPDELSGGMRSRVALARSLITKPKLMLLDEAFSNLDEYNRVKLNCALAKIQLETQTTVVMVTHNISEAVLVSDQIIVLNSDQSGVGGVIETIDVPQRTKKPEFIQSNEYKIIHDKIFSNVLAGKHT